MVTDVIIDIDGRSMPIYIDPINIDSDKSFFLRKYYLLSKISLF